VDSEPFTQGCHARVVVGRDRTFFPQTSSSTGGSVAEWLECWIQAQKGLGSNHSLRQTVHTHRAAVHQTAKVVAALLRVARVTAGLAESNGSLSSGLSLTSPAG